MTIRALIVDDEAVARRRIRRLLAAHANVAIVGECGDGATAVKAVDTLRPHLMFLDVQMPELDGFQVVEAIAEPRPAIVFVTAFDRYALRAFDVHAIDYLLKPFTAERFRVALERACARIRRREEDEGLAALLPHIAALRRYPARIAVRTANRIVLVDWADVDWLEAADNYVKLHVGGREHLVRDTLTALERQLDPDQFVRIHRSAIVRIDRVDELAAESHGDFALRLRSGTRLTVSRTFRDRLERALGGRI